jgi:Na+-driven multidrug efflux pump
MGAAATMAGQNLGAGRPERALGAIAATSRLGVLLAGSIGSVFLLAPRLLLGIFGMTEPHVTAIGRQLLTFLSVSGLFITVALSYTGGLQGTGDTKSPLYISIIAQIVVPLGLCTLLQAQRGLQPSDIWLAILLGHMTRAVLSVVRFRQGRWRQIAVDIPAARR